MHDDHHRLIDDEIDTVARSLTASPPSSALRSAVRSRIAETAALNYTWRWSLGVVAAAVVIGIALVWPGGEAPVDTPASRETVAAIVPAPATAPSIEPEPTPPSPVARRASPESEPLIEVEMLELQPLELEPLDVPVLALEAWDVEPLALQQ